MNDLNLSVQPLRIIKVGSRVTCNPAPTDTDQDFLVLVDDSKWIEFCDAIKNDGFELGGSFISDEINYVPDEKRFNSFTRGVDNLICTRSVVFFDKFMTATALAKRFNLLNKYDRIALFQGVLYGNSCDYEFVWSMV